MRESSLESIHELARRDDRVVFIGSDVGPGTLARFQREIPGRFFVEGISEQHIVGMAAGLALEGYVPFVVTIGTFLTRRCFEQIVVDVCLQGLPVRLLAFGGGVVYAPLGPTHLATEDIGILRPVPNMSIAAPCDAEEMRRLIRATGSWPGPLYIRMGRGGDEVVSRNELGFSLGRAIWLRRGTSASLISTGVMTQRALAAAARLERQGAFANVLHVHTVKPLDTEAVLEAARTGLVVTVEEHVRIGGLGSAVLEALSDAGLHPMPRVVRLGLPDRFVDGYGTQEYLLEKHGLDTEAIVRAVVEVAP